MNPLKLDVSGRFAAVAVVVATMLGTLGCSSTTRAESSPYFGKAEAPEGQTLRYISG